MDSEDYQNVFRFFSVIEKHFDEVKKGSHSEYEQLWKNMIVWCQWFHVIRFNNKECLHSFKSEQISKVIPSKLVSLATPISAVAATAA